MHVAVPAQLVEHNVMVQVAVGFQVLRGGGAAVRVVDDVVRFGLQGCPVASGPGALPAAAGAGDAGLPGDLPGPANVEDQGSGADHSAVEEAGAEVVGEALWS